MPFAIQSNYLQAKPGPWNRGVPWLLNGPTPIPKSQANQLGRGAGGLPDTVVRCYERVLTKR